MPASLEGCRKKTQAERYHFRCHFYKRIQRDSFVAVSLENQSDRLVSNLVTASEEYEEDNEGKMKTEDFEVCSLLLETCSRAFKVTLQHGCSKFNPT